MRGVLRNELAAVAAYVTMFATLFILFTGLWAVIGADGAFEPGSWDVSGAWTGASLLLGFVAALAGGRVCAKLGVGATAMYELIGLIVVLSILSALPDAGTPTGPRPPDVTMFEAMSQARQPPWLLWLNPVIGILGVVLGGRRLLRT